MIFDCSLENVQVLVTQCIFLLNTSQTDRYAYSRWGKLLTYSSCRCSNTLGLAIKIAQAIGLHLEDSFHLSNSTSKTSNFKEAQTRRRTWYTMYNMDRLLALQLGRPLTIHEGDYVVNLPLESNDQQPSPDDDRQPKAADGSSPIDFFIAVIRFTKVVSRVINDLYGPSQRRLDPNEMLAITSALDELILLWKAELPRHLRFDIAHVFEKSIIYKRQVRNPILLCIHD